MGFVELRKELKVLKENVKKEQGGKEDFLMCTC